jgi:putative redox protein
MLAHTRKMDWLRKVFMSAARSKSMRTIPNSLRAELSTKTYELKGIGKNSQCQMESNTGWEMVTDVPLKIGGKNSGPQPVELLLASLCGCEQATAMYVARHINPPMTINRIEFRLEAVRDQKGALTLPLGIDHDSIPPARLGCIKGTAHVYTDATQKQVDLLEKEVIRRCPVANMVILSGCDLQVQWIKTADDEF